jgi:hypothetical protein
MRRSALKGLSVAKKTERQKLDAQLIELFSRCVRARDKVCRNCGSGYRLQAHHIIARQYKLGRYNTENGLCICSACHFHEKTNHEKFRDMILSVIGETRFNELKTQYMRNWKWTVPELKEILDGLKTELRRIEEEWGTL